MAGMLLLNQLFKTTQASRRIRVFYGDGISLEIIPAPRLQSSWAKHFFKHKKTTKKLLILFV